MNQTINLTENMTANMTAGPAGPAGAAATADDNWTFTLAEGAMANVTNVGTLANALFDFFIPVGATGATGATGPTGPMGPMNQTINLTSNQTPGVPGAPGGAGGYLLYFNHTASPDVGGYEELAPIPAGSAEDDESVTVKNGLGEVIFDPYVTIIGTPGLALIPAGLWQFRTWHYVDGASGTTTVVFKVYNRTAAGAENLLFTATSDDINALTMTEYVTYYVQTTNILISLTDRLVIKVYGQSTHASNIILHFVYEGNIHTSHVQTPLLITDPAVLSFAARADGADIKKGQAVYISGASGNDPIVTVADNTDSTKCRVVGIMVADTPANALGLVRRQGVLTAVDTQATNLFVNPNAETWLAGDLLFSTATGGMTKTRPTSGRSVKVAYSLLGSDAADVLLIYPLENPVWVTAAANEDVVLRLGDNAGETNVSFRDYANNQIASIDSDGNVTFTNNLNMLQNNISNVISRQNGDAINLSSIASFITTTNLNNYFLNDTSKSLFGNSLRRSVNNDYLSLIGGTGSTPYSGNLQLYGGDNVAMSGGIIMSVGNASGASSEVVFSALGRTDTPVLSLSNNRIADVLDPTLAQDASTKNYVDKLKGNDTGSDHGLLTGLTDDDHVRYFDKDGSKALTTTTALKRDVDNSVLIVRGSTSSAGKGAAFALGGADSGSWVGGFYITVPNAAKNNDVYAFQILGDTDSPFLDMLTRKILNVGNISIGSSSDSGYQLLLSTNNAGKPVSEHWTVSSDEQLKKDIVPITNALNIITQLQPKEFAYIDTNKSGTARQMGFIAQDVEKVIPQWVSTGADGYKTITITGDTALLVEAIKEQQVMIDRQQVQINNLTERLTALEKKVGV